MALFLSREESSALAERLAAVTERITAAAKRCGRSPDEVTLLCVAKKHSARAVAELCALWTGPGPLLVGENYMQEALEKQKLVDTLLREGRCASRICWHFIGHVQSRKSRDAPGNFSMLHTLDSEKLASALQRHIRAKGLEDPFPVLIQVNVGEEPQKSGVWPEEAEKLARAVADMPELALSGLMCIPPLEGDMEESRRHFAGLRAIRETLSSRLGLALPELSMGMSHDLEAAVEEGATMVRIGTDIFGPRA